MVACLAFGLVGATLALGAVKPVLGLGGDKSVRGSHFKAHELIRVVFSWDVQRVRIVRASAAGSFAALLPSSASCASLRIRATGASGDIAALALSRGLCPSSNTSGTQGSGSQPWSGTQGSGGQPSQSGGGLPDPYGPPTINPGPN
jgi:hypothetical protein